MAFKDAGNSVIVVEHDEDMMRASDFLVDIGPGAGIYGGQLLRRVLLQNIWPLNQQRRSINGIKKIQTPSKRRKAIKRS